MLLLPDANLEDPLAEYPVQKRLHEAKKEQVGLQSEIAGNRLSGHR